MEKSDRDGDRLEKLYAEAFAIMNETGWFVPVEYNALFQVKWKTGECVYLGQIPGEEKCESNLYISIVKYGNYLVMAPFMAYEIALYDLEQQTFEKLSLRNYGEKYIGEKFCDVVCCGNDIFFIPMNYPAIVRLDMSSRELHYIEKDIRNLRERNADSKYLFNIKPVVTNETLWLGCYAENSIIEFNMKTFEVKTHRLKHCSGGMSGICYDGDNFWIVQYPSVCVISWNPVTKEERIYDEFPHGFDGQGYMFSHILCEDGRMLLLPQQSNMILTLDAENDCLRGIKRTDEERFGELSYSTYFAFQDKVYYVTERSTIVKLNNELQEEQVSVLRVREEDAERSKEDLLKIEDELQAKAVTGIVLTEKRLEHSLLDNYIKAIQVDVTKEKTAGAYGEKIYQQLVTKVASERT